MVMRRVPEVDEIVQRIQKKMKPWGITLSFLAQNLGVSRQYAWQIIHYRTTLSRTKALGATARECLLPAGLR